MGKKSRRNRVKTTCMPSESQSTSRSPPCTHRAAVESDHLDAKRRQAVEAIVESCKVGFGTPGFSQSRAMCNVLKELEHDGLVDEQLLAHVVAYGVDKALAADRENGQRAFVAVACAIIMEHWLAVGGEEFEHVLFGMENFRERRNYPWFAKYNDDLCRVATQRDILKRLDQRAPCDCLASFREEIKRKDPKQFVETQCIPCPFFLTGSSFTSANVYNLLHSFVCSLGTLVVMFQLQIAGLFQRFLGVKHFDVFQSEHKANTIR